MVNMFRSWFKPVFCFTVLILFFYLFSTRPILALSEISDTIFTSRPGFPSNHTIIFKTDEIIPASGKIIITPQAGAFSVITGFDYTDVDIATSSSIKGVYSDRSVASSVNSQYDGVTVDTGATSTLNSITITLSTSAGISADLYIKLEFGTNATSSEIGDLQIVNPASPGMYPVAIEILDNNNNLLSYAETVIAIIESVTMRAGFGKYRYSGTPSGILNYGTTQTLMSLYTNYKADCRFDIASGTPYGSMTSDFSYTGEYFHSIMLTGLTNGTVYSYFIRCRDELSVDDTTDYLISFEISGQPGDDTGSGSGPPGSGGGGSGGGSGSGLGQGEGPGVTNLLPYPALPGQPGVVLEGWAYPSAVVTVLQDGQEVGRAVADSLAKFGGFLADLNRGVYTFGLWANDILGRRSITYTTTFWIDEGTQTTVSDIILSPTIELNKKAFTVGESITIRGYSAPAKTVEAWLYPAVSGVIDETTIIKREAMVSGTGEWTINFNTSQLTNGTYKVKARTKLDTIGTSEFSQEQELSIGGAVEEGLCQGADLNGDGRVNLVDFSILLYYWGTDDECADQNKDGTVDLIDFSIMLFYWTG